jgi:hypothetical protein
MIAAFLLDFTGLPAFLVRDFLPSRQHIPADPQFSGDFPPVFDLSVGQVPRLIA